MQITPDTTIESILNAHPMATAVFSEHGLDDHFLRDPSMLGSVLTICKSSGNINDLDGLMLDLQSYIDAQARH